MELAVDSKVLSTELAAVSAVCGSKSSIPILGNVMVSASPRFMIITATDLELAITSAISASVKGLDRVTVPCKLLAQIAKSLPPGKATIKFDDKGRAEIKAGKSRFMLSAMPADNFPHLPDVPDKSEKVACSALADVLNKVKTAVSGEASRYMLNAALLTSEDGKLKAVATDGHRLAIVTTSAAWVSGDILLPSRAIAPILSNAQEGDVSIASSDNHLFFSAGDRVLTVRKLTGQFPNYKNVLPTGNNNIVTLDSSELLGAIRRVSVTSSQSKAMKFSASGDALTLSSSGDAGEATEAIAAEVSGDAFSIGFNYGYVADFLGQAAGKVTIAVKDDQSAALFTPADDAGYQYVAMPMRV